MKIASFIVPHAGGTWTAAVALHHGLAGHGIALGFVACGRRAAAAWSDPAYGSYRGLVQMIAPGEDDPRRGAQALLEFLRGSDFDGAIIDVLSDPVPASLVRHLPESFLRLMVVHNITPGTYAVARRLAPRVHAIVAISPRMERDLVRATGLPGGRFRLVPHGLPAEAFGQFDSRGSHQGIRVAFVGRIEDSSKNVFLIPEILRKCAMPGLTVSIAGDGPDLFELKARCSGLPVEMAFLGALPWASVRQVLGSHDIFLMPSRYEGFGLSLLEAMAAGCVPVVTRINGVTDSFVRHGENGWLFPVGDAAAGAAGIGRLGSDALLRGKLGAAARATALGFRQEATGRQYAELLIGLQRTRPDLPPPVPLSDWQLPTTGLDRLRASLPGPIKNTLRQWRERWRG